MRLVSRVAWLLAIAVAVAACGYLTPDPDDPGEAVGGPPIVALRIVEAWWAEVIRGEDDLGWDLLYPNIRTDLFGSEDVYRSALAEDDWTDLSPRISHVRLTDGEYHVYIEFDAEVVLPSFLDAWGMMQRSDVPDPGTILGFMTVRVGTGSEPTGIQATG